MHKSSIFYIVFEALKNAIFESEETLIFQYFPNIKRRFLVVQVGRRHDSVAYPTTLDDFSEN